MPIALQQGWVKTVYITSLSRPKQKNSHLVIQKVVSTSIHQQLLIAFANRYKRVFKQDVD